MSDLSRLTRIVRSWTGKLKSRRSESYGNDDIRMILTNLGYQMKPETLNWLLESHSRREDLLMQLYAAEEELGLDIILYNTEMDAALQPKVYDSEEKVSITITARGKETIVAEAKRGNPWAL